MSTLVFYISFDRSDTCDGVPLKIGDRADGPLWSSRPTFLLPEFCPKAVVLVALFAYFLLSWELSMSSQVRACSCSTSSLLIPFYRVAPARLPDSC